MTPPKLPIIITTTPSYNDSNQPRRPSTPTSSTNLNITNNNSLYPSTPPPTFSLSTPTEEPSPEQTNNSPLFSSPPDLLPIPEGTTSNNNTNLNNNKYSFNYSNSISSSNNHSPSLGPYDLSPSTPSTYPPPSPSTSFRSVEFADEPAYTTTLNLRDNHDVSFF